MYRLGIIGENISYTLSPLVHNIIFSYFGIEGEFKVYDTARADFGKTVQTLKKTLNGFNVTKPFKRDIVPYLTSDMSECGAVNTVVCGEKAVGYNTDGFGFAKSFSESSGLIAGEKVLVLGAGGAAREIIGEMNKMGLKVLVYNRTKEHAEELIREVNAELWQGEETAAVVNCTSCGLRKGDNPLSGLDVKTPRFAFDLIYSPPRTDFLEQMKERGVEINNGFDMLVYQAVRSDELIIPEVRPTVDDYKNILEAVRKTLDELKGNR